MNNLPQGIWSVMLTAFHDDKSIDLDGLKHLTDFYLQHGCDGLFAACSSSEVMFLSKEEIITLCRETVKHVNGRAGVVGGAVFQGSIQQQADFVREIADTGVQAVVITTNQICPQDSTPQQWRDSFFKLLDLTDVPLGIYESPFPFKRLLTPEEMSYISQTGRVFFHKDTCCEINQIKDKLTAVKDSTLNFYNANVHTLVDSYKAGGHGYCGTAANLYPELLQSVWRNFDKENYNPAKMDFIIAGEQSFCKTYPCAAKYFLKLRGVKMGLTCRMETNPFEEKDRQTLIRLFLDMQQLTTTPPRKLNYA